LRKARISSPRIGCTLGVPFFTRRTCKRPSERLKVHLGWAVQAYNAAGALPNLINPFWMVPLLAITSLKARDLVGFTVPQLAILAPLVLLLLWLFAPTLAYHPPVFH
jgi:short-chain fatty acids transporter